jgi:hypothetical protein
MSEVRKETTGIARVTVTDNGREIAQQAWEIPADQALTKISLPLQYGGLFARRHLTVRVEFDPAVIPEGHNR